MHFVYVSLTNIDIIFPKSLCNFYILFRLSKSTVCLVCPVVKILIPLLSSYCSLLSAYLLILVLSPLCNGTGDTGGHFCCVINWEIFLFILKLLCFLRPLIAALLLFCFSFFFCKVSVLGLLSDLRVDLDLHMLLFGESVLNDAVAIVLTQWVFRFSICPSPENAIYFKV